MKTSTFGLVLVVLCLIAYTESKPCDIRRWRGCKNGPTQEVKAGAETETSGK